MFDFFKCKHPADTLHIYSHTPKITPVDEDFEKVTFELKCFKCGSRVDVSALSFVDGVDAFLNRGAAAPKGTP